MSLYTLFSTTSHFFFFNDTPTTEIYTLSLHDALPIFPAGKTRAQLDLDGSRTGGMPSCQLKLIFPWAPSKPSRSEEHTSELQSRRDLVCRLLLEKKKNKKKKKKTKNT